MSKELLMENFYPVFAEEFQNDCQDLAHTIKKAVPDNHFDSVYPIPKNGFPVLLETGFFDLPIIYNLRDITTSTLILDDILDSGQAIKILFEDINKCEFDDFEEWDHKIRQITFDEFLLNQVAVVYDKQRADFRSKLLARSVVLDKDKWISLPWENVDEDPEKHITRILEYLGEDPTREGLRDTPKRVVKSWRELYSGYGEDAKEILSTVFEEDGVEEYDQMIVLENIDFYSTCEHHMLPFFGKIRLAYIGDRKVVGLSKLARLVDCFARRLQIQERMTRQIADCLQEVLEPKGVGVIVEAKHLCMCARGVNKQNGVMKTSALTGVFLEDGDVRKEFMGL